MSNKCKEIKKARSAVRLVRSDLGEKSYRDQNHRLGDAGRTLSDARDAAVKLKTLEALRDDDEVKLSPAARDALAAAIAAASAADDSTDAEVRSAAAEAVTLLERAREPVEGWMLEDGGWRLIGPGLDRAYRGGRSAYAAVAADPSDEGVHEWRKRAKDLWYQLRLLKPTWPEVIGELDDQAHALADLLGDHHDLALLAADLESSAPALSDEQREALADLVRGRQEALLAEALPLGERIYAESPKAFARRMRSYWRAWRG